MGAVLLAVALVLMAPVGTGVLGVAGAQAPWPNYEPVPTYTPAEEEEEEGESSSPSISPAVPAPAPRPNRFSVRRVKRLWHNGRAIVFVRIFAPGRVIARGRDIRTMARGAGRPSIVRVPVRPKSRLRRHLHRRGKAKISVRLAFRPYGGAAPPPRERTILLRKKLRR